jgi:hypothetical protein
MGEYTQWSKKKPMVSDRDMSQHAKRSKVDSVDKQGKRLRLPLMVTLKRMENTTEVL